MGINDVEVSVDGELVLEQLEISDVVRYYGHPDVLDEVSPNEVNTVQIHNFIVDVDFSDFTTDQISEILDQIDIYDITNYLKGPE